MCKIITSDFTFDIHDFKIFEEELKIGFPENCQLDLKVSSFGYSCTESMEIDFGDFCQFVTDMTQFYDRTNSGATGFSEHYGSSFVKVYSNNGLFEFTGEIHSKKRLGNSLIFNCKITEAEIAPFIEGISKLADENINAA